MAKPKGSLFGGEESEEPLINLTPLIDVVFVVLIAFMVIAPLLEVDKVQLAPGPSLKNQEALQQTDSFSISVREDNTIWVDQQRIALSDLDAWLQRAKKRHPGRAPKLFQDSRAQFGTYQAIKNRIEACGFEELDVVLQPQ